MYLGYHRQHEMCFYKQLLMIQQLFFLEKHFYHENEAELLVVTFSQDEK